MADNKTKKNVPVKRRSAADIEARNRASVQGLIDVYGPKGDGKKPASTKKK